MSGTLPFIDRLLAIAGNLQHRHQDREAIRYLGRLAALPDLPRDVAEEVQVRLAEMQLQRCRYRRARRHLAIALLYRPECARYHYLMGAALSQGCDAEPERAIQHYRRSLVLDADQPRCRAELGWLLVREGQCGEGLAELQQAAGQAPDDPAILRQLVRGLCRGRRPREAMAVLRAARFRRPRDARIRRLYQDFMFRRLCARQRADRRAASIWNNEAGPVLLRFVQPDAASSLCSVRLDEPQSLPGPHQRRPSRRPDWKHG
jgi:Flp pilus assembly protein TadD